MSFAILQHTEGFGKGQITHDVERKPVKPFRDVDRGSFRAKFTDALIQQFGVLVNSQIVGLERYNSKFLPQLKLDLTYLLLRSFDSTLVVLYRVRPDPL